VIYDTVDLHFLREQRRASLDGDPVAARDSTLYHGMELALARAADATFVVSSTEKALLLAENPALQVYVIPTIHRDEQRGRPFEDARASSSSGASNIPLMWMGCAGWLRRSFPSSEPAPRCLHFHRRQLSHGRHPRIVPD